MLDWTDEQYDTYLRIRSSLDNAMHIVTGSEFKVLVFVLSRSFGKGYESVAMTLTDFHGKGREGVGNTGLSRASVIRCIASLMERGLITRTLGRMRDGFMYRVEVNKLLDLTEPE